MIDRSRPGNRFSVSKLIEHIADGAWRILSWQPIIGACLWALIGFMLIGLASTLDGLAAPTHELLEWLCVSWRVTPTISLAILFLVIRILSVHLQLNHMRVNRQTGVVLSPPMFSADRPAMGRAVLLGLTVALLDAVILRLTACAPVVPSGVAAVVTKVASWHAAKVVVCAVLLGVQTGLIWVVLWIVDRRLAEIIKERVPASRPLLRTRDVRTRLRLACVFGGLIYLPIALGLLLSSTSDSSSLWVLLVFLAVQLTATAVTEIMSLGIDWRNGQWIQNLGHRLAQEKEPARRLPVVEHMVRFGEFAGPVWPELPAALEDTASLGALSARQLHLGVQLAVHITEGQWAEAAGVGEIIVQWFPGSRLAAIVREKEDYMREKSAHG